MLRLIDGNNYLRRTLDSDLTGLVPRNIFANAKATDLWVWDAPDGNARRRSIYPEYKMGRPKTPDDIRATVQFVKDLLVHTSAMQITVPGYEADDVIATFAKSMKDVHIVSNDSDYLALGVPCDAKSIPGVEPKYVRLYKTLVGDTADNIPGIKGFGAKKFQDCSMHLWDDYFRGMIPWVATGEFCRADQMIEENIETVRTFYQVVGFFDVPLDLIQQHLSVGVPNFEKGDAMLRSYLQ